MTQENKDLLLKELCARLPYGICANLPNHHLVSHKYVIYDINTQNGWTTGLLDCAGRIQAYSAKAEDIKLYLRPISSMTDEEVNKLFQILKIDKDSDSEWLKVNDIGIIRLFSEVGKDFYEIAEAFEYLNSIHIDYRGLIPEELAIEVTKENNPYESKL